MVFDVEAVRRDFKILCDSPLVYLDNAAATLTPEPVLHKMLEYYRQYRANTGRGIYANSQKATDEFEAARKKLADFVGARSPSEIVLVKNTTEGLNAVANGLAWKPGDKVVVTILEHHSNFLPWLRLKRQGKIGLEVVRLKDHRSPLSLEDVERAVDGSTRLVAVAHASNVLGTILPVREIANIAHEKGALMLVDGAQTAPHLRVNVREMGCDFFAFSGQKMCGPTGAGALYVREEAQELLEPVNIGGGPVVEADSENYQLEAGGARFEAGTPGIAEAIGFGAAVDYLRRVGLENIWEHEVKMAEKVYWGLVEIPNVEVYGPEPRRGLKLGVTSFNIRGMEPHDVALALDVLGNIAVRSGRHCAHPLIKELLRRPEGTVRASTYFYNTEEEVERFLSLVYELASGR